MHRTVTALYDTQAQAEAARDALRAAHLGDDVDIRDQSHDDHTDTAGTGEHHGIGDWLKSLFGGHPDRQVYGEGLRRGHFLLAARVDELNEIRAATILDSAGPVDMHQAETSWRNAGWTPQSEAHAELAEPNITADPIEQSRGRESVLMDGRVRGYDVKV